jgi:hypothetical protein
MKKKTKRRYEVKCTRQTVYRFDGVFNKSKSPGGVDVDA